LNAENPPSPHGGGRSPAAPIESATAPLPTSAGHAASFCENKLAAADPAQYYSVLFIAREKRLALIPLYALWQEVREIVDECREPEIARVKLAWWHEELHETIAGRPRHPVSVALAPILSTYALPATSLFAVIEAVGRHAEGAPYASYAELRDYGKQTRGAVEQLAASVMGAIDFATKEHAAAIGALLELTALLRDTGLYARRSHCYLPLEDLARFGVAAHEVCAGRATESIDASIKFEAQRLRTDLQQQVAGVPASARTHLTPLLAAAALSDALLAKIAAAGGRVLRERPALLPLRQLWIAWRSARASRQLGR
jgi:15-cis-phytoene synthase